MKKNRIIRIVVHPWLIHVYSTDADGNSLPTRHYITKKRRIITLLQKGGRASLDTYDTGDGSGEEGVITIYPRKEKTNED